MAGASKETSWHFDPKRIAEGIFVTTIGGILVTWATGVIGLNLWSNNGAAPAAVTTTEPPSHSTPSFVPGSSESNDDGQGPSEPTLLFHLSCRLRPPSPSALIKTLLLTALSKLMGSSTFTHLAIDAKTTATKTPVSVVLNLISAASIGHSKRQ